MKAKNSIRMKTGILITAMLLFLCIVPEAAFSQPPNDNFADAIVLTGVSGSVTGTNIDATKEPGEYGWTESSVWYSWTAPETGAFCFDTHGSDFDTVLAGYTGLTLDSLTEIAVNYDDGSDNGNSSLIFRANAGTLYYISIRGDNYDDSGNIVLNWRKANPPANDNFADSTVLTGVSGSVTGTNIDATEEPDEYGRGESSVWYSWTAPETGAFFFDTRGSNFDIYLWVYTGSAIESLTMIASSDNVNSSLVFRVISGTRYYVRVSGYSSGSIVLNWRKSVSPNDFFADATVLTGVSGSVTGTNIDATKEPGECQWTESSVWYSWTAPETGAFYFDIHGSSFGTILSVYTGSAVDSLTEIAYSYNDGSSDKDSLVFHAISGTRYYLSVDNAYDYGSIVVNWRKSVSPNDFFADATLLTGVSGQIIGTNAEATEEPGESSYHYESSVWYSWTAPETGAFYFDTHGSSFDTFLEIYTGSAVDSLTTIAYNNDDGSDKGNSSLIFRANAGTLYYISIRGYNYDDSGNIVLNWRKANPPANDNFADATVLTGVSGQVTGTNIDATEESDEYGWGESSVWYSWTEPETCAFYFDTHGSSFDTLLTVYTGSAVDSLTKIAYNNDDGSDKGNSSIVFRAEAGTRYYIAVESRYRYNTGDIILNRRKANPPANDNFADATVLTGVSGQITGTNIDATEELGEDYNYDYDRKSVWYSWTAPESDVFYFGTHGSSFYTYLAAYTGSAVDSLTEIADSDDSSSSHHYTTLTFRAEAGTRYYIAVYTAYGLITGNIVLNWKKAVPPANDNFADATVLTGVSGQVTGTNIGASSEPGEYYHGRGSIWYSWTAPETATFYFDTHGSDFDMILTICTGSAVDSLTTLTDNNDDETGSVVFRAEAGTRYYIAVGISYHYHNNTGDIILNWRKANPPANDNFADATVLTCVSGRVTGTNIEAMSEPGEPGYGKSVWYSYIAPETGAFYFDTEGSSFDTYLTVYTGSAIDSLTKIAYSNGGCSDNSNSSLVFCATSGSRYYIAVGSYYNAGDIVVNWRKANPPANDNFADAIELTGVSGQITGTNAEATEEPDEYGWGESSVWYSWTAPETGAFCFAADSSDGWITLTVYTGSAIDSLTWIVCNFDAFIDTSSGCPAFRAEAGTRYYIAVESLDLFGEGCNMTGSIVLNWGKANPPANDNFADATELRGMYGRTEFSANLIEATREPWEPEYGGGHSVWYSWTAPKTGVFYFNTDNSDSDSEIKLAIYTDSAVDSLTRISDSMFYAQAGIRYHIAVDLAFSCWLEWSWRSELYDFILNWEEITSPTTGKFEMDLSGRAYVGGRKIESSDCIILAFGPGGISDYRGKSDFILSGEEWKYYFRIVSDNDGEEISFKVADSSTGQLYDISDRIIFKAATSANKDLDKPLRADAVYPSLGEIGKSLDVTVRGLGFDENTKVLMYPDIENTEEAAVSVAAVVKSETELSLTLPAPPIPGTYTLSISNTEQQFDFKGAVTFSESAGFQEQERKKALIVAGRKSASDSLWKDTQMCTGYAYLALLSQGYTRERIYFLSPENTDIDGDGNLNDIDGNAVKNNLEDAITGWAAADTDEMLIYMTGHGENGIFYLNEAETLKAEELDGWLDALQTETSARVILIYDACMSGSFIPLLKPPEGKERIVITGSAPEQYAWFQNNGILSFSYQFWRSVSLNAKLYDSFAAAADIMKADQTAYLDADGDGTGYLPADTDISDSDKAAAEKIIIGRGRIAGSIPPVIGDISEEQAINKVIYAKIQVWNITSLNEIKRVWAVIMPPDSGCGPGEPVANLPTVEFISGADGCWEGVYKGFIQDGIYKIAVFAEDEFGAYSDPAQTTVKVQRIPGDLSRNGSVGLEDAVLVLKTLTGTSGLIKYDYQAASVDVNGDKRVGMHEGLYILREIGK